MSEDFPFSRASRLGVDGGDDALGAKFFRRLADEVGILHRGGVDGNLIGAGLQQSPNIFDGAHPATDGKRHKTLIGRARDHAKQRIALLN